MVGMANLTVTLGDYLREQRRGAQLSLRQLAAQAGVSNPYLSQIERGLRRPSAEVLQQLAKALRISAETMYVRAGMFDADDEQERSVHLAVLSDPGLTQRQKQALLDIYDSFRREYSYFATLDRPRQSRKDIQCPLPPASTRHGPS